jgi:hypothetical protein
MLSSYWLAHFYLMKKSAKVRDVRILYSQAVIQRTIDVSPAFLEHSSAEKIATQAGGWIKFCLKRLRTLNSYQIFKIKNKNNNL